MVHCSVFIIDHTKAHSIFAPLNSMDKGKEYKFQGFHSHDIKIVALWPMALYSFMGEW
jgi:hypothetical protein